MLERRAALQICGKKVGELWTGTFHNVVMTHPTFNLEKRRDAADFRLAYLMRYGRMTYPQILRTDLSVLNRIRNALDKLIQAENGKPIENVVSNSEAAD